MKTEEEKQEPLAAILAEMREFCSGWSEDVDVTVKVGLIYGWACRLKEAAERERDEWLSGNHGMMREALERCNELFRCDDDNKSRLCHLARKADEATQAALAAPARNCDILSEEAARKAWYDYRHANVLPRGGWDFRHIIAWLFAPAKEGGAE